MKFVLANNQMSLLKPTTPLGDHIIDSVKSKVREESSNLAKDITLGILDGLRDILIDFSFSIALVGGGILVILQMAGYKNGYRYAGILFVGNVLINYLLGGD